MFRATRIVLCLWVMVQIHQTGFSQQDRVTYVPPSPNAASLLEYASIPVNLYTGTAQVNIPLYELKGRRLSVPVSISYHASGIKVQDISSSVGLGWALNAGGVVTRIVRGLPDEGTNGYFSRDFEEDYANADLLRANAIEGGTIDSEPDIYFFNFNGKSGRFVMSPGKAVIPLPEQGLKFTVPFFAATDPFWEITDIDGVKYVFGKTSNARETTSSTLKVPQNIKTYISSWYLSEIRLPFDNEVVKFTYHEGNNVYFENYRQYQENSLGTITNCTMPPSWPGFFPSPLRDVITEITINTPKYIAEINIFLGSTETSLGKVSFEYDQTGRQDLPNAYRLRDIVVQNLYSTEVGRYKLLNEEYFVSDGCSTSDCKRLKLSGIVETTNGAHLTKRSFSYNTTNLPARNSVQYDHWGYYNSNPHSTAIPTSKSYNMVSGGVVTFQGADKSPDLSRTQACILTQIVNSAGGLQKLFYQLNEYDLNGDIAPTGGLRVERIEEDDGTNLNGVIVKSYKYRKVTDPDKSSGIVYRNYTYDYPFTSVQSCPTIGVALFTFVRRFSGSLIDLFDIGGVHVGYSDVQIEYNNGAKEHLFFTDFVDHADDPTVFKSGPTPDYTNPDGPPFVAKSDRSYERGLLDAHWFYHAAGNKLKHIRNYYDPYLVSATEAPGGRVLLLNQDGNSMSHRSGRYKYAHRGIRLIETTEKTFDPDNETNAFQKKTTLTHDATFSTLIKTSKTQLNNGSELMTEYRYPSDYQTPVTTYSDIESDAIHEINKAYMIGMPLEEVTWLKRSGGDFQVTGAKLKTFKKDLATSITSPYEEFELKITSPVPSTDFNWSYINVSSNYREFRKDDLYKRVHSYDSYDAYGNLLQETGEDGVATAYEWGHNSSLVTFVRTNPADPQVRYFDHIPMIGLNYITDPAGRNTYYSYDVFNRLKLIKDHDSNIVSRYRYHYKNANEFNVDFSVSGNFIVNQTINFSSLLGGESAGTTSLIWDFGDGQISEDASQSVSHSYPAPGTYKVTLTKVNPEYEPITATHQVVINNPLAATIFTGSTQVDVCAGPMERAVTLVANVTGGCEIDGFEWFYRIVPSGNWTAFSLDENPTYQNCIQGTREFKCIVTDKCGNSVETSSITVNYSRSTPDCPLCSLD